MMNTNPVNWLEAIKQKRPNIDAAVFENAQQLLTEDDAQLQGQAMVDALLELQCDNQTLTAALIYPQFLKGDFKQEKITQDFGKPIYKLLVGTHKMDALNQHISDSKNSAKKHHADQLRKMLLAMVDDVRVVLIKLAYQLTLLKQLKNSDPETKKHYAEQTMHIYAPLANRLGIGQFKWLLEDLSFRYLEPEIYHEISKKLKMRRQDREQYIQQMIDKLNTLFRQSTLKNVSISGRAKHIYSIHNKLQRKGGDFGELYDTSAFRILVSSIKDCYTALGVVHATWPHIEKEFDDYIAKPKPNGYRSIHTAVIGPNDINVEIQIRTHEIHDEAELGVAAHWKYKEGKTEQSAYEEKINWLREVIAWQKELTTEQQDQETLLQDVFEDRVYVFTPNGDIFDLANGATPLDFAYHIHTDVGHRCRGAKINDVLLPLTHKLKTGDRVSIMTAKENKPSRDWLNPQLGYLKTSAAISKVRHWFAKIDRHDNLSTGLAIWEKAQRKNAITRAQLQKALKPLKLKTLDDLFIALGSGHLSPNSIATHIHKTTTENKPEVDFTEKFSHAVSSTKPSKLDVQGVGQLLTQVAKCCKPIPGDEILGYITKGHGISIHQKSCANITNALNNNPERIIDLNWGSETPQSYPVDLIIEADDRPALVRDISTAILNEKIPLLGIQTRAVRSKNFAQLELTIEVKDKSPLSKIITLLSAIPGVISVKRRLS